MYRDGKGVAQDNNETVRLYRQAADQGIPEAQYGLGILYFVGTNDFSSDLKTAHFFLSAAEAQGYEKAHELLEKVEAALHYTSSECSDLDASPSSQCTCCGRVADNDTKLKSCPRCKGPLYCGKDCQRAHWKGGHKECCTQK
mmetsp:Transcript_68083/g.133554  ORF Transcript_68083/g.133554 Transcript_68083/m.133554 type:complete len:142 (-) Transcript_68083:163-588(-)